MERPRPWHPFRHPGFCGIRGTVSIIILLTFLFTGPILWWEKRNTETESALTDTDSDTPDNVPSLNMTKRLRRSADWWYTPQDFQLPPEWSTNRWFHWLMYNVREVAPNSSCMVCFPPALNQDSVIPVNAEPASEALTRCLLMVTDNLTAVGRRLDTSNQTACRQSIMNIGRGKDQRYYNSGVCLQLCDQDLVLPDNSTDKSLRSKSDKVTQVTSFPPFGICRGVNQTCATSSHTTSGFRASGQFLGNSSCAKVEASEGCSHSDSEVCMKVNLTLPVGNISGVKVVRSTPGLGMMRGYAWVCGNQYYTFLPPTYAGCCFLAKITTPLTVIPLDRFFNTTVNSTNGSRRLKRDMARFSSKDYYHYRISLGEKWGIGLFPWYGVTFLADHIDNITADLFAYMTANTAAIESLNNAARNYRAVILKHEMVLDYLFASEGGMCKALNLTVSQCCVLAPDPHDNITQLVDILNTITSHFKPSDGAGVSAMDWLYDRIGPWGTLILQILIPIFLVTSLMICFCTVLLTCMKALIHRYVDQTVGNFMQIPHHIPDYDPNRTDSDSDLDPLDDKTNL